MLRVSILSHIISACLCRRMLIASFFVEVWMCSVFCVCTGISGSWQISALGFGFFVACYSASEWGAEGSQGLARLVFLQVTGYGLIRFRVPLHWQHIAPYIGPSIVMMMLAHKIILHAHVCHIVGFSE